MLRAGITPGRQPEDAPPAPPGENSAPPGRTLRDRLGALYDEHGPRAFRFLLALLGNRAEAEDALQAVFVELARNPEVLDRIESPGAYLIAAARNIALRARATSERRRTKEAPLVAAEFLAARDPERYDPTEVARLERAIRQLPDEQREVLCLKAFERMTFNEIAAALGIPANTAASRYRYALDKLRTLLGGAD